MIKLYLDIDGVLLTIKHKKAADHSTEFIQFITENFDCYWLTTHCKGDSNSAVRYLSSYFESETLEIIKKIKPTQWSTFKTEAIDFSSNFIWLDDYPFPSEIQILMEKLVFDKLKIIDLSKKDELLRIVSFLKERILPQSS